VLFHALKTLVREHPRAAFGAAAAGASYAVKDVAKAGHDALSKGLAEGIVKHQSLSTDDQARAEFERSLHPEDRRTLSEATEIPEGKA
jgi:hypothetical protein